MPHQITIQPSGHTFIAEDDETILAAALRLGFMLPYGCRNGACGTCKGSILSGEVDYGEYQASTLTDADITAGKALFCVACARNDITIECREVGAAKDIQIKTMPSRVHKMTRLGHDVMGLHLKLPASERLQFLAGQYIDILLKNGKRRSFSLANAPHDDAFLQLHIRYVPGGEFTEHVFNQMKDKDILRIEGPLGNFFLREDDTKPIIFIAGGTGFAPIQSMITHALHHHLNREMVLYWGARQLRDLYLPQIPSRWQQENPNFTFIPVLSEPTIEDAWSGRNGLVVDAVIQDFPNLSGYQVYACGAPSMVEAAQADCIKHGLPENEFYADAFSYQSNVS
ncbi:MAG: CDP-6-deoxy-delta-3,4-glucoseen reductase [Sulfuriferula sp.]